MHNELIGSKEACEMLSIDRSTLTRWVQAKKIEPVKKLNGIRGANLFDPADIEALARTSRAA
jgi:predicted site-specific integrase-resolvase